MTFSCLQPGQRKHGSWSLPLCGQLSVQSVSLLTSNGIIVIFCLKGSTKSEKSSTQRTLGSLCLFNFFNQQVLSEHNKGFPKCHWTDSPGVYSSFTGNRMMHYISSKPVSTLHSECIQTNQTASQPKWRNLREISWLFLAFCFT